MISFFRETIEEAKRLQVPTKRETYVTTLTILVVITIVSLAILCSDFVITKIIGLIFGL